MPLHELGSAWRRKTKQSHCRVLFSSGVSLQWCMGVKISLYKCDVLQSPTSTQINRISFHYMLRAVNNFVGCLYNLEFFHEIFYLKQNFANPQILNP